MPALAICMVSLNCRNVVEDCLESLRRSRFQDFEIVIVDNGSTDETLPYLRAQPDVKLIENGYNAGFTKGTNQGITSTPGQYVLWLNTDTILQEDSLGELIGFLESHPEAGIVGPRVLNKDGSFQPQCKRGVPTPLASLAYSLRIDRIWPDNPRLSQYLLRTMSEHEAGQVGAVSGCCLMARRSVVDSIGLLDETMFAFGEDIEWCVRASKAGWQVWYYPGSVIVHLKGQGGAHSKPYHKVWGMHQSMWLFYRKHLAAERSAVTTGLVAAGIAVSFSASILKTGIRQQFRRRKAPSRAAVRPA